MLLFNPKSTKFGHNSNAVVNQVRLWSQACYRGFFYKR